MRPTLRDPQSDFPQAVASLNTGQHPAIPRTDADLAPLNHIQAIVRHGGIPFRLYRGRRQQSLPDLGPEGNPSTGLADPAQYRPDRDLPFPDLARQSWQRGFGARGSSDRWQSRVSGPQCTSLWWGGLPDQSDHARAMPVPQPKIPAGFDHSGDLEGTGTDKTHLCIGVASAVICARPAGKLRWDCGALPGRRSFFKSLLCLKVGPGAGSSIRSPSHPVITQIQLPAQGPAATSRQLAKGLSRIKRGRNLVSG
jgi:hypothetical protein